MQARISLDLILIENLVQILAYSLLKDGIALPGRALIVTRELLRGICLGRHHNNAHGRQADARFEIIEGGKLRIRIQEDGPPMEGRNALFALQGTSEYGLIKRLSESVRFEDNIIEAIVSFCPT